MLHNLLKFHALLEAMYMIILSNLKKLAKNCVRYPSYKRTGWGGKVPVSAICLVPCMFQSVNELLLIIL
jgi:hypothetical protein